jgi:molybdate transport system substrate-binding protein
MRVLVTGLAMVLLTAIGSGCGGDNKLTVYAAASLRTTFTELGQEFETSHKGARVVFNFAGSSDLLAQIQQGAPADVLASADTQIMDEAVASRSVEGDPVNFASNTLEIAVPPNNPAGVHSLQDLVHPGIRVVVCAPQVPCGAAAKKVEEAAGLHIQPVSEEQSVSDVLNKVSTDAAEADAGLVYVTDVKAAGDRVRGIPISESSAAVNTYPIAVLRDGGDIKLATEFVNLVTGPDGQAVLAAAGFGGP